MKSLNFAAMEKIQGGDSGNVSINLPISGLLSVLGLGSLLGVGLGIGVGVSYSISDLDLGSLTSVLGSL
jgi:hypothetical protein